MADKWQDEHRSIVAAFKSGDISLAEHLLNHVHQPNDVTINLVWTHLKHPVGLETPVIPELPGGYTILFFL